MVCQIQPGKETQVSQSARGLTQIMFLVTAAAMAFAATATTQGQDVLKFEVEEYTTPKDAWQVNRPSETMWNLWSTDRDAEKKWSGGVVLQSPTVMADRETPEEGAPVLHTHITDIPNGKYHVQLSTVGRGLAISFDGGETWEHKRDGGLGVHKIRDGTFDIWVDDRYAHPDEKRRGSTYYDAILFTPVIEAKDGVINGGFEAGKDGKPMGWATWSRDRDAVQVALDEDVKHEGRRSARIEHAGERDWVLANAAMLAVEPKQVFTIAAWIKTEGEGYVEVAVVAFGQGERISWSIGSARVSGTADWTQISTSFRIPDKCDTVQVRFVGAKKATAWLDDVRLTPGVPPRPSKPTVHGWAPERVIEQLARGVVAIPLDDNRAYVGWRLLAGDPENVGFNLYRRTNGGENRRINGAPLTKTTDFLDSTTAPNVTYEYIVRTVITGREGRPSESVKVTTSPSGRPFLTIKLDGDHMFQKVGIADLDGDGRYDFVIKQPEKNIDPADSYWYKSPDTYKLEAYSADGTFMWRYDLGWSIERGIWYSPYVVYDFNGDGKAEVAAKTGEGDPRDPDGRVRTGTEHVTILDGLTGREVCKVDWPSREGYRNYNITSRNQMCVAYLDGKTPCLIAERGTYGTIKVVAYQFTGGKLHELWSWDNRNEPSWFRAQGAHIMHGADIDGDGRDEVVIGSAVVDDNGVGLWSTGFGHPDFCFVGDIDPVRPGLEIFYGIEPRRRHSALCLVDAKTGDVIWGLHEATNHVGSDGMCADIDPRHPGLECHAHDIDRQRKFAQSWIFSASGELISKEEKGAMSKVVYWDGDLQKELLRGSRIVDYEGGAHSDDIRGRLVTFADILGDWREEIITTLPGEMRIYTTTIPAKDRRVCLMQDPIYRLDVAVAAMGYWAAPMLSYCPSGDRADISFQFESDRLLPDRPLKGELVVVASTKEQLLGTVVLHTDANARITPTQVAVAVSPGQVHKVPLRVETGLKPDPLGPQLRIRLRAVLHDGDAAGVQTETTIPIADMPLKDVPIVQAEDMNGQGNGEVQIRGDKLGSAGKAFSHWDNEGHWIEWEVAIPKAGDYHLVIRYCATAEATRRLLVDSQAHPGPDVVLFPSTGGFGSASSDCWMHLPVRTADGRPAMWRLDRGTHTIRMSNVCGKGLNMDYLAFVTANR